MREWIQKQYSLNHCYSNNCLHKLTLKTVIFNLKQANKLKKKKEVGETRFTLGFQFSQPLSRVRLFTTPWAAARQASLSITNSWSLLKLMSIESVMPFNHLILCRHLLLPSIFPSIMVFSMSQFTSGGRSIGASASASVLPMNIQDWFPLGWTGWISLLSKGLSRGFSNTTVQKHQFFSAQPSSQSNSHIHTWPQEKPELWLDGP